MSGFWGYKDMPPEAFRKMQLIELDMLLYFDGFCKKHGLRYYMAGGTLIGAVRHKGFIPWDEDIDLHMPRPDYARLPALWEKYADTGRYTLCVTDEKRNFRHNAYAIADNNTTLIEERTVNDDIPQGIRMDILAFDGVPKNRFKAAIQRLWSVVFSIYNVQRLPENQGGRLMKAAVGFALNMVRDPGRRYRLWRYAEKQFTKYSFESSPYVREFTCPLRSSRFKYPRKDFDKAILLAFEGHMFPAQRYYRQYLENVYPDYMELPPAEKRGQKTRAIFIDTEKGYKAYKGLYYCTKEGSAHGKYRAADRGRIGESHAPGYSQAIHQGK